MAPPTESPLGMSPLSRMRSMSRSEYSPIPFCVMLETQPSPPSGSGPPVKRWLAMMPPRILRGLWHSAQWRSVHQIGAAIPLRRLGRVGLERLAVEEQEFPAAERAPDREVDRQIVVAHPALHRRQRLEIAEQVAHV